MNSINNKAVIFDLDGTLVDSLHDLAAAVNVARQDCGFSVLPIATIGSYVGNGVRKLLQRSLPDDIEASVLEKATDSFQSYYADHCCVKTVPYVGALETVQSLHADGWAIGVATNKPYGFAKHILETLGFMPPVTALCGGDQARKPAPEPLYRIAKTLDVDLSASWMVGDHDTDLAAGAAAGCKTAWCSWGIGHTGGLPYDVQINSMSELLSAVRAMPQE